MTGRQSSARHILFLWKTNLIPDGEASSRRPPGVSRGLTVSPIGSGPFAQCPEWPPSLPAPPWKVEHHLSHTLPGRGEVHQQASLAVKCRLIFTLSPSLDQTLSYMASEGLGMGTAVTWRCHSAQTDQRY